MNNTPNRVFNQIRNAEAKEKEKRALKRKSFNGDTSAKVMIKVDANTWIFVDPKKNLQKEKQKYVDHKRHVIENLIDQRYKKKWDKLKTTDQ